VDLALDPFPYQGTTTTLECLAAGVPVMTRVGQTNCRRASSAFLLRLGLDELVTASVDQYVEATVALARRPHRLRGLREGLRDRFLASEICDVRGFAAELEAVYRRVWGEWCRLSPAK
jgi:protein O-GlcNAc transferase